MKKGLFWLAGQGKILKGVTDIRAVGVKREPPVQKQGRGRSRQRALKNKGLGPGRSLVSLGPV